MEKQIQAPFVVWKVGDKEYKLKLITGEIERLERTYNIGNIMNPIIMSSEGQLPSLVYLLDIIHGAIQKFHSGYSRADVSELYDDYIEAGGSQTDLMKTVLEVFKVSGFFPKQKTRKKQQ